MKSTRKRAPRAPRHRRKNEYGNGAPVSSLAWCTMCQKEALDKENAKRLAKLLSQGDEHKSKYRCPYRWEQLGWWHVGKLPQGVIRGARTRGGTK